MNNLYSTGRREMGRNLSNPISLVFFSSRIVLLFIHKEGR